MPRLIAYWCALLAAFMPAAARANWLQAETPHFRLYSNGGESSLRRFATMVENYDRVLRIMTNTTAPASPVKLDVYLLRSGSDLRKVRSMGSNVAGFYSATPGYIAAFAVRVDKLGLDGDEVLFHEYAHHFMMQYHPAAYPAWYVEGFAEFMMTATVTDKKIEVGGFNQSRAYGLVALPWLPIQKVLEGDLSGLSSDEAAMFYSQSWLIVHWAFSEQGRSQAMLRYLKAISQGEDGRTAFEREMGMDYEAFARQLKKYVSAGRIRYIRFSPPDHAEVPVEIRQLSAGADDLLLPRAALLLGMSDKRGAATLPAIRGEAARYPDDTFAKWTLAAYEMDFGDTRAGNAMADALIAGGMNDAETLFLRGYGDLVLARKADHPEEKRRLYGAARLWFAKAFRADENYFPALWAYVETRSMDPMDENTLSVLLRAQQLAPQVAWLRFQAAVALMRNKEFASAAALLGPLAADPHGGRGAEHARKLLNKARSGEFAEADLGWNMKADAEADEGEDDASPSDDAGKAKGGGPGWNRPLKAWPVSC